LLMLLSLVLFGRIDNQAERDDFVFPLHVAKFSPGAIWCRRQTVALRAPPNRRFGR
jgi:hypothetical protein